MYETFLYTVNDSIATITFNRPDAMNSFNVKMSDELKIITEEVKNNPAIRAVLLNGAGKLFMAGGDIQAFYSMLDQMPGAMYTIIQSLNTSIMNLMQMPKPVLASVHGSVAGVGLSFMMACDLVIAADNTKFTMAYSGIGISPDGGATFNLPRLVGTKKAMELILMSDLFDAHTAQTYGLVNWVVAPDKLAEETQRLLKRLAAGPTQSYMRAKKLVNEAWQNDLGKHLEIEGRAFTECTATRDFKTGVTGFIKKQKAEFIGS